MSTKVITGKFYGQKEAYKNKNVVIRCDGADCIAEIDTGMWDFADAFDLFKRRGWRATKVGEHMVEETYRTRRGKRRTRVVLKGKYLHACPSCQGQQRAAA